MSGPIVPPLEVTEVDGNPSGRPITKIIVSNGDLSISGRTATIDTSGSGGIPGTPADSIQFNSDPAGTFTGDAGLVVLTAGGGTSTAIQIGAVKYGSTGLGAQQLTADTSLSFYAEGTGQIFLQGSEDGGGTWTDTIVNVMADAAADSATLRLRNSTGTYKEANFTLDGNEDLIIDNDYTANNDIDLKVGGTGIVEIQNTTTDTEAVLSIMGNGTGDAKLDLQNASKRVWVLCDENKKLKIQGGAAGNTFIFDVSSASGGITFPDSTTQSTAATGVTFPLEAPNGSESAAQFTFSADTGTGLFRDGTDLAFTVNNTKRLSLSTAGVLTINSAYSLPTADGDANQILTTDGAGAVTFEDAAGGGIASVSFAMRVASPNTTYDYYPLNIGQSGTTSLGDPLGGNNPQFMPFTVGEAGDLADVNIYVSSASTSNSCVIGIYTSSDGLPDTKISEATLDCSSTGTKSGALDATTTLAVGVQYWVGFTKENTGDAFETYRTNLDYTVNNVPSSDPFSLAGYYNLGSSNNTLPATVTTTNLTTSNGRDRMMVTARF